MQLIFMGNLSGYSSSTTLSASNLRDREDPSGGSTQRNALGELRSHHPPFLHKYDLFSFVSKHLNVHILLEKELTLPVAL
jgi:hypothetical protein